MKAKVWTAGALTLLLAVSALAGCSKDEEGKGGSKEASSPAPSASAGTAGAAAATAEQVDEQPGTSYYEIFVRSYYDSNGDGIGDIKGMTEKLDYLNDGDPKTDTDLGVEGIWLMPVNASPSYHGYDVSDYYAINPQYGTLEDFKTFLSEAHKRGIKVIMDLVVNHTSSQHPWFKEAAADANAPHRSWYTWAPEGTNTGEGSATGSKAWHKAATGTYLGAFWEGMPDLNFDNPDVRKEMKQIGQFWLKAGVDGFRLDAAKHIYENLTSDKGKKEVTEKNMAWWKEFRSAMKEVNPKAYIVGEVWENSAVSVAPYLEAFDSSFNFGAALDIVKSAQSGSGASLASNLERTYGLYNRTSKGSFVDATFLTNHDQDRVMSVLKGNRDQAKMAAAILLTLPGNPFIYYGEEIGMTGKKPDEYIREPMVWYEGGKDGPGMTKWETAKYNRVDAPSVEAQQKDPASLLSHYKMLLRWRSGTPALKDGGIVSAGYDQNGIISYHRRTEKESALVIHNLSDKLQTVTLTPEDGKAYKKLLHQSSNAAGLKGAELTLPPYSTVVVQ